MEIQQILRRSQLKFELDTNLNIALEESLEKAKSQVALVLAEHAQFKYIATGEGKNFLLDIESKIPENLENLKLGFKTLANFDLEYHGLIQHRIRKHLDVVTPDRTKYKFNDLYSNFFGMPNTNVEKARKIHHNLRQAQIEAVNNCEKELKNLLIEPSQAGFAIVEEFVDRVLRAEDIEQEWQFFIQELSPKIWQTEFESINANSLLKREWSDLIEQVREKNTPDNLNFSQ